MAEWYATGGPAMWLVTLIVLVALPADLLVLALAVAGRAFGGPLLRVARVGAVLALLGSALPGCVGVGGWLHGRAQVDRALALVDVPHREEIRAVGYAEALVPLQFGGGAAAALVLVALLACAIALPPSRARPEG